MITFMTYNVRGYGGRDGDRWRDRLIEDVIGEMQPDVIGIQGLAATSEIHAEGALLGLAEAVGMRCRTGDPRVGATAVTRSSSGRAVGLMWQAHIAAEADSVTSYRGPEWHHGPVSVDLHVGGQEAITHTCYEAPPKSAGRRRPEEAAQITALARFRALIAGAWGQPYRMNAGGSALAEEEELWDRGERPENPRANREAARLLAQAGFRDAAVLLGRRRPVTTGHGTKRPERGRPVDAVLVSADVAPMVLEVVVVDDERTRLASPYLPTGVRYDPAKEG